MTEIKGTKINFLGIISVLTLIFMGIGTTFAYFSARVTAENSENISVSTIEVVMNLKIGPLYNGKPILPTNDEDIFKAYENKCVDSYGNGACFAYTVELENMGYPQEGIAVFNATSNDGIRNLKYMVVSLEEEYEVLKGPTNAMNATEEEQIEGGIPIKLGSEDSKKIVVVVWISNLNKPQDEEQGATFEGQVSFTATSGAKITGTMTENVILKEIE